MTVRHLTPVDLFPQALLMQARGIRVAIFDVDGVLTDGRIHIDAQGEVFKSFNALDGHGLKLLRQADITPVVITGRDSEAVRRRMQDLQITQAHFGVHDKLTLAQRILPELGADWATVAMMGDDWPDLPLMQHAKLVCAPPGAHPQVTALADFVTSVGAGEGAARQLCDLLLMANGHYDRLLQGALHTLDDGQHARAKDERP